MKKIINNLIKKKSSPFSDKQSRKNFLKNLLVFAGSLLFTQSRFMNVLAAQETSLKARRKRVVKTESDLAVIRGEDPRKITRKAMEELGGMSRFVNKNDIVVVKPNIGWDREPQYAANTNPDVVYELVRMCLEAGAARVKVFDNTCNTNKMCYINSGIHSAVKKAGGEIYYVSDWKFIPGKFPDGSLMKDWPIFRDAVECDCFINVPVAKHHSLAGLTLSMKNLMGVCSGNRGNIHVDIDRKLAELTNFINPDLTVIDAYRILLRHGPSGGNLSDVKSTKTVIAGTDPVLADAYAATLFNISPSSIGAVVEGVNYKLGSMDLGSAKIKKIEL